MGQEEELLQRCRRLEEALRDYDKKIVERDAEIARLKKVIALLAGPGDNTASAAPVPPAASQPKPKPVPTQPQQATEPAPSQKQQVPVAPREQPRQSTQKPVTMQGDSIKSAAAPVMSRKKPSRDESSTSEKAELPATYTGAASDAIQETESDASMMEYEEATGPGPLQLLDEIRKIGLVRKHTGSPTYAPGQFIDAVLEGEDDEGQELRELLIRLKKAKQEEIFGIYQALSTCHNLLMKKMVRRFGREELSTEKRLFIRFGMLDDALMDERPHVWEALIRTIDTKPGDSGIYYLDEWLEAVFEGEHPFSSIDELALGGGKADREATGAAALAYELQNAGQMMRMCVGPRGNKTSILLQQYCQPGPENPIVMREWLAAAVNYAAECDSLLYYRRYKGKDITVKPVFIIVPGYGERGICWEPFNPGRKGLTGPRICICAFPPRSSMRTLLMGLGDYRWEYAKQDARQYWMSEGLTGDWLSMFKGNEQRQDMKALFVASYIQWAIKEALRTPILDKRFRSFFWLKIPFSDDFKQHLRGSAVYTHLFDLDEARKAREAREAAEEGED